MRVLICVAALGPMSCRMPTPLSVTSYPPGVATPWRVDDIQSLDARRARTIQWSVRWVQHARAGASARAASVARAWSAPPPPRPARAPAERGRVIRYGGVEVIEVDRGPPEAEGGAPSLLPAGEACVDVNAAPPAALEGLPGIGPARAAGIVEGRPYARPEELERVAGIGPATLARLLPRLCQSGP